MLIIKISFVFLFIFQSFNSISQYAKLSTITGKYEYVVKNDKLIDCDKFYINIKTINDSLIIFCINDNIYDMQVCEAAIARLINKKEKIYKSYGIFDKLQRDSGTKLCELPKNVLPTLFIQILSRTSIKLSDGENRLFYHCSVDGVYKLYSNKFEYAKIDSNYFKKQMKVWNGAWRTPSPAQLRTSMYSYPNEIFKENIHLEKGDKVYFEPKFLVDGYILGCFIKNYKFYSGWFHCEAFK